MGLLDDAIREHLDLKRRRGADPTEVARLEHEALGPVRRERAAGDADDQAAAEPAAETAPEPDATPQPSHQEVAAPPASPADRAGPARSSAEPEQDEPEPEPEPEPDEPRPDEPEADESTPITEQPTTEYRVEDHHDDDEGQPEGPSEDVLEETPDFLQETPEHDRLWFEQRPPRDFDFDG